MMAIIIEAAVVVIGMMAIFYLWFLVLVGVMAAIKRQNYFNLIALSWPAFKRDPIVLVLYMLTVELQMHSLHESGCKFENEEERQKYNELSKLYNQF